MFSFFGHHYIRPITMYISDYVSENCGGPDPEPDNVEGNDIPNNIGDDIINNMLNNVGDNIINNTGDICTNDINLSVPVDISG